MLKRYWFATKPGIGYGVTASSVADAENLLQAFGYPRQGEIVEQIITDFAMEELDANHVLPNSGPLVIRGVWFPCHNMSRIDNA